MTPRVGWRTFSVFFLTWVSPIVLAKMTITRIVSPKAIEFHALDYPHSLQVGQRYPIYSKMNRRVVGFAEVTSVKPKQNGVSGSALVLYHSQNEMVLVGDEIRPLDFRRETPGIKGRVDIMMRGKHRSARYKPLVYQGVSIGQTAESLSKGEHLIDIFSFYAYGLSDRVTASSILLAGVMGTPNFNVKTKLYESEWFIFSPSFGFAYWIDGRMGLVRVEANIDFPTNSKFVSHTSIAVSANLGARGAGILGKAGFFDSSLRSGYAYIFDNWDRLLFGPKYNFELGGVGGYLAYMFIWDRFHFSINLECTNLTKFRLGIPGYLPHFSMFWRL